MCDTTLVHVDGAGTLSLETAAVDAATPDVDLYVYRSDGFGVAGPLVGVSASTGPAETVHVPAANGSYLVAAVSFSTGSPGFSGRATLAPRGTVIPDVDAPRGSQETVISDPNAGAASQPALALDDETLVAAYRVFADPAVYSSRIATAVSFDRGERWQRLPTLATGANPALAFSRRDALLATDESRAIVLRRWARPTERDVQRDRTWSSPVALSAPGPGETDERPALAASGRRATRLLGANDRPRRLRPPGGALPASDDRGMTWESGRR